ncbi:MAG: DUF5132 domain-containing protein [Halothiobacillaceae bacterium]|nr:MAG: DUF5132 domain-containing protein [Halothiobacillaceae bacterium]
MAMYDDLLKGGAGRGLLIGLGAAVVAPVVLAVLGGVARPLSRAAVKTGIIAYEKGREAMAEVGEVFDDLVAEARVEIERKQVAPLQGGTAMAAGAVVAEQPGKDNGPT